MKIRNKLKKITSTLKGKLSLWYLFSINVIILVFLTATATIFWITIKNQIDHHVHIVASEAAQIVQEFDKNERDNLLKNLVSAKGMTIILLSPDGAPLLETNSPDIALVTEHQLLGILSSINIREASPVHFTESGIRFAAMPVEITSGKGILAVGYSTQVLYETFVKMVGVVLGIILFVIFPITFVGYQFIKKELKPLEEISRQAQNVTTTTLLANRITTPATTLELITIKVALNGMLDQLQKVFIVEKEFFSDAAHTLKTPLAVLRSQIETSITNEKNKNELLSTIDKANETIQDLLFLAKIETQTQSTRKFSLSNLMNDLKELATTLGEDKNLIISSNIQEDVFFTADRKQIQRALSNIVHNAVMYNKQKGSIDFALKQKSNKISIEIRDSGIGINKHDLNQVYSRFFRGTTNNVEGSGLGLAISKAVIENSSGTISINSSKNTGTKVSILFNL